MPATTNHISDKIGMRIPACDAIACGDFDWFPWDVLFVFNKELLLIGWVAIVSTDCAKNIGISI
jgi:hypothetical protein